VALQRRWRSCRVLPPRTSRDGVNGNAFRRGTEGQRAPLRWIGRSFSPPPGASPVQEAPASPPRPGFLLSLGRHTFGMADEKRRRAESPTPRRQARPTGRHGPSPVHSYALAEGSIPAFRENPSLSRPVAGRGRGQPIRWASFEAGTLVSLHVRGLRISIALADWQ
jgi:hypothetical protein